MIELKHLHIAYDRLLLHQDSIKFYPGQISLIAGESGIGKTSLLYRIALISSNMDYEMYLDGVAIHKLKEKKRSDIRRYRIGFVLQEKDIIEHLDVYENLCYYALMANRNLEEADVKEILHRVSLNVPVHQDVMTLSLGERQRLAIACALAKDPDILILDEPTASLDHKNEDIIFQILDYLAHVEKKMVIIASHSEKAVMISDWVYHFEHQKIQITKEGTVNKVCGKDKEQRRKQSFSIRYVKQYLHKYRYMQIMMTAVIAITMLTGYGSNQFLNLRMQKEQDLLYSQFDAQLFLMGNKELKHVDEGVFPFEMKEKEAKAYPYIKAVLSDDPEIEIVPYFDSSDLEDKVAGRMELADSKGIYFSDGAKNKLHKTLESYQGSYALKISLFEYQEKAIQMHEAVWDTPVNGVLKKGVLNYYTSPGKDYIYVYYPELLKLYESLASSQKFAGYTLLYENYEQLKTEKLKYEALGYGVNDDFVEMEAVEDMMQSYQGIQDRVMLILHGISLLLMIAIGVHLFYKRKKEMAILKLNGIQRSELRRIFYLEYAAEFGLGMTISFVLILGSFLFLHDIDGSCVILSFLWLIMSYFFISLMNACLIHKIDVEKELR